MPSVGAVYGCPMCAQCASVGAVTATAGATGARIWLAAHQPAWLTPVRMRVVSGVVVTGGVLAAGLLAG